MFGRHFTSLGFNVGKSMFGRHACKFSTSMSHMYANANFSGIQTSYLKMIPTANVMFLQNLREMLLGKREMVDLELAELTSVN